MRTKLLGITFMACAFAFAQKNEIKEIDKALKSGNFVAAQTAAKNHEGIMEGADSKTKAKYYFLRGKAFLGNGNVVNVKNIQDATNSFKKSNELGKNKYKGESDKLLASTAEAIRKKAMNDYSANKLGAAADKFRTIYELNGDMDFLFSAAQTYRAAQKNDEALASYLILDEKEYTGQVEQLIATDKSTGEIKVYNSALDRTIDIKAGTHTNPKKRKTASERGNILRAIVNLYLAKKDTDGAINAIAKAKKALPKDASILIEEANIYYEQGDNEKFKSTLLKASQLEPKNLNLLYNIGVVSAQSGDYASAEEFYKKALNINSKDFNTNYSLGFLYLEQVDAISKKMRELGSSAEDDKKYEAYLAERKGLQSKALPYFEKASEIQPDNADVLTSLFNLYTRLKMSDKRAAVDQKLKKLGQ